MSGGCCRGNSRCGYRRSCGCNNACYGSGGGLGGFGGGLWVLWLLLLGGGNR